MLQKYEISYFKYVEGTGISSTQIRTIRGTDMVKQIQVGSTISIQEDLEKLHIVETIGNIRIDRWFLRYYAANEFAFIPIYNKVYDSSGAHIYLNRVGIEYALDALDDRADCEASFLKEDLFDAIINEICDIDYDIYDLIRDRFDIPTLLTYTDNDDACYIPEEDNTINYPWNIINYSSPDVNLFIDPYKSRFIKSAAHSVSDLSVGVNINDIESSRHPISIWLDDIFDVDLGEEYANIAFDKLSSICLKNPELEQKDILKCLTHSVPKHNYSTFEVEDKDEYEPVEEFTSELMLLCVWLHTLPFVEIAFEYILPYRGKRVSSFKCNIPYQYRKGIDLNILETILTMIWCNNNIVSVKVFMVESDEVYLTITEESGIVHKYYIDLFLTTMMTQNIVRKPRG